jgi:hypothetical protein
MGGTTAFVTGSIQPIAWAASDAAAKFLSDILDTISLGGELTSCLHEREFIEFIAHRRI